MGRPSRNSKSISDGPPEFVGRRALQGEVGKDLVKLPVYEIEKQLLLSGAAG